MTKAPAFGCPFDQARNICDNPRSFNASIYHAELWDQRGKRVVCDSGTSLGNAGDQGRFPGVGKAYNAHVREELKFKMQEHLYTRAARCRFSGRTVGGTGKGHISFAGQPAFYDTDRNVWICQVRDDRTSTAVTHDGTDGDLDEQIFAGPTGLLPWRTRSTGLSGQDPSPPEVGERVPAFYGHHKYRAAATAITAVWAAIGHKLFASERRAARATLTAPNGDLYFVQKPHSSSSGSGLGNESSIYAVA